MGCHGDSSRNGCPRCYTSSMSSRVGSKAFYRIYADVHIYRIYADVHNTRWLMMRHPQVERLYKDLATARII